MKILRIDNDGVCSDAIYKDLESLRLELCSYHSIDWQEGIGPDDKDFIDIYSLSLEDIMEHGNWSYKKISDEEAKQFDDHRY